MRGSSLWRWRGTTLAVCVALVASGCGDNLEPVGLAGGTIAEPTAVEPMVIVAGSSDTEVMITGEQFMPGAIVLVDGNRAEPATLDATTAALVLPRARLEFAATIELRVVNPGAGASAAVLVEVVDPNAVPTLLSLAPDRAPSGASAIVVTISGTRFAVGARVQVGGADRPSARLDSSTLEATLSASDLASPGALSITVVNPGPGGGASAPLAFLVQGEALPAGVVERASVDTTGGDPGNECRDVDVSADGRFVVFYSDAADLVATDSNSTRDVFVRDTCRGASGACTPSTSIASLADNGAQAASGSQDPTISADGRFIAFFSNDPSLTSTSTTGSYHVYVRDTCHGATGCTPHTYLRSLTSTGTAVGVTSNRHVGLSDDGRFVLFASSAPYVPGDTNNALDYFVHDSCTNATGCTPTTVIASVSTAGASGATPPSNARLSRDGRYVVFESTAPDLVTGDSNNQADVFLRDTCLGAIGCSPSTIRVSVTNAGAQARGTNPSIGASGRFVLFSSESQLVTEDTNTRGDAYLRDTCIGAPGGCTPQTILVSVPLAQPASDWAYTVAPRGLSSNGRHVVFLSYANNVVAGDTNNKADLFVRDTCAGIATGCTPSTTIVSRSMTNAQLGGNVWNGEASWAISPDARFVAFNSDDAALVSGDGNNTWDVFLAATGF